MSYSFLGQDLFEVADGAKKWFSSRYGATRFLREQEVLPELPLRPTWQAQMKTGYRLCLNVQPTPFSPTLHEVVNVAVSRGLPIKLWVAVGSAAAKESFGADLRAARNVGIGVLQVMPDGDVHEFHRAVPLSLFGLARTPPGRIPAVRRETIKNAEDTYLDGSPDQGCQAICQELEDLTRRFAHLTYTNGWWKTPAGAKTRSQKFFLVDSWATMLEEFEERVDLKLVVAKAPSFSKQALVKVRAHTDWRNAVSHKPKSLEKLKARDAQLRTMFEATRQLLLEWYGIAKPLGIIT